ncbi:hypothetical protein [Pseudoalteromonas shioyasakiensis]|uniref:hypothetical protein n=1 Tax=Pseudoalteromonas shioyasakiensis TaxID=1190813 RepID=UPI001C3C8F24|nr:hypothetical protein [Pseudoalteromonas shioyasakiensis]
MLKGNYKAWIISISLHAVLLVLFARYGKSVKLPAVAEPPKVINAYVSVDLTSLPSLQKIQEKPSPEQTQEMPGEAKSLPKNEDVSQSSSQQISDTKVINPTINEPKEATSDNQTAENSKIVEVPFKKLNPYAPIPQLNFENRATSASAFGQVEDTNNNSSAGRVTVPAQLTVSDNKATVVWQNGDGSKRIEVLNGMCYGIDFNSVFGKSGVPSGSPRPCEDKEAKLFKEIMNKWSKK